MKKCFKIGAVCILATLFNACSSNQMVLSEPFEKDNLIGNEQAIEDTSVQTPSSRQGFVEHGTNSFINNNPNNPSLANSAGNIDIDFNKSDLIEFLSIMLGDLLNLNYLIDPAVTGTVTLHTSSDVSEASLLPLVNQVLAMNDASLVQRDNFYRVIPTSSISQGDTIINIGNEITETGYSVQIFPLEFISATEMKKLLEPVVADTSTITVNDTRNLIIASGSPAELLTVRETIDIFDVDWLKGMSVGLFPLTNVDPVTLEAELTDILNSNATNSILGGLVRLVPLERLTSLLVVSSTTAALREVETWIHRLDTPEESSNKRLYIYPVQNANAVELADTLSSILQTDRQRATGATGENRQQTAETLLAPGLNSSQISTNNTSSGNSDTSSDFTNSSNGSGFNMSGSSDIQIIGDDVRNTLVILASSQDYKMIEAAIQKLDTVSLQVLIEAKIIEVKLRNDLSLGVEWFFDNKIDNDFSEIGTLDLGSSGITALAPGFSYTLMNSSDQVSLALNALASESEINILSSPSLMVLDNQAATINVGDEIPVPTRQSISNIDPSAPTVNEITYRQTGITLNVNPRVNTSGLVTMILSMEVSLAATTNTSNLDAPTISNRKIESVVSIHSGETIMLGGLILEQDSSSESGLPLVSKIPVIGNLFKQQVNEDSHTELLILITPRVIRDQVDAREVTDEYRSKLLLLPPISSEDNG